MTAITSSSGPARPMPRAGRTGLLLLGVIVIAYAVLLWAFFVPAHPGVDQNGYMTTGRELAQHGRLYYVPHNPYQFIGAMMVQLPNGRVYAKYPPGVGILAAVAQTIGGRYAIYCVDPICMVVGITAAYFLFIQFVDEFLALIGVLLLATNPVILQFADDANSHGAAFGFTVLGFCLLMMWLRRGGWLWGIGAGVVLGFCPYMRYTEALWCIPLLIALLIARFMNERPWREIWATAAAYAVPLFILMTINWISFGYPWRTGYWYCGEQGGFSWRYFVFGDHTSNFQANWITALGQFENFGLFLIFPLVVLGLGKLWVESRRWALLIAAWMIPGTIVYLFYYWAPNRLNTVAYLRFFIDVMPAMILCALWAMRSIFGTYISTRALTVGVLAAMAGAYCLMRSVPALEQMHATKEDLATTAHELRQHIRPGAVVFADGPICDYLGSISDYRLYNLQLFSPAFFQRCLKMSEITGPNPLQKARVRAYIGLLGRRLPSGREVPLPLAGYHKIETSIIRRAEIQHKTAYFVVPDGDTWPAIPDGNGIRVAKLSAWRELLIQQRRRPGGFWNHQQGAARTMMMALYRVTFQPSKSLAAASIK